MLKVYKSVTGEHYNFPVTVNTTRCGISVSPFFTTEDVGIQKAVESYYLFTQGMITTENGFEQIADQIAEVTKSELTSFPEVTTINQAKEVLRGEPYNVHHMKLRTPDAIMAQAIEHSVTFPNWTI